MQVLLLVVVDLSRAFCIVESIVLQDATGAHMHTFNAPTAADLLSVCKWKMQAQKWSETKCNVWERFDARSLGTILSLLRWRMLLCEESAHLSMTCQSLGGDCLVTTARVAQSRKKHVLITCVGQTDMTVKSHRWWSHIIRDDASLLS